MKNYQKILIIRLGGIGDIMFTLPSVKRIMENFPESELTFLTYKEFADLIQGFPSINAVLTIDRQLYEQKNLLDITRETRKLYQSITSKNFDLVVDFQYFGETAFLSWISGAQTRLGFSKKNLREKFYNLTLNGFRTQHVVDHNLELLEKIGIRVGVTDNSYNLPRPIINRAAELLTNSGYSIEKPTIFIQPFTNSERKNWPLKNYLEYAEYWKTRGIQILFGGGPKDRSKLENASKKFPVTAGKADLMDNVGLMYLSTLTVGGDTGLLHIATAMGKKVLMLMGPTSPQKFCPYRHLDWVVTPHVKSTKMNDIPLEQVIHRTHDSFEYQ